jgi:signal transduction histidine kinase
LVRSTSVFLGVCALLLLAMVAAMAYLVYETQADMERVARARQLRSTAADLLMAIQDAETGQRGYLLTRQDMFLKPYINSIDELQARGAAFQQAAESSDDLRVDFDRISATVRKKIAELQQTIALAQAKRIDEALAIVRNETGLRLMAEIRASLSRIIEQSDHRIAAQSASNLDLAAMLRVVTFVLGLAVMIIMVLVVVVIRRYVDAITLARRELEDMNLSLEERVRGRTEDLIQANQEIQRFAYIVTHDLRAPLVNIMGFTSELDSALKDIQDYFQRDPGPVREAAAIAAERAVAEDLPEAIQFIRASSRKMDDLINAILKISRDGRRPLQAEPLDLESLIRAAADVIRHQVIEADGEITVAVRVRKFISDRFSIERILGNLLDNAVKYREPSRPLKLLVRAFEINRLAIGIEVVDNGRGIATEDHERVFELFRRSGAQVSLGEGIGLAHVRSLVRNMGGEIGVKSELGKGASFMIRLPSDLSGYVGSSGQ